MRAAAILVSALVVTACHTGGNAEEARPSVRRDVPVPGPFDRVQLAGSTDVVVTVGGAPSIRAEGDQETLDRLEIVVENGQLRIGLRPTSGSWLSWGHRGHVTVHVTAPAIAGAALTGSGDLRIDRVQGQAFDAAVTGSGDMNVGAVQVENARFTVTGSGGITATGRARAASGSITGSGDLNLEALEAATATLSVAGSGSIDIRATETAAVELRGSGDINVTGTARCTVDKAGSGDVRCNGAPAGGGEGGTAD